MGCFLKITGASKTSEDTEVRLDVEEGEVCRALEGNGLISVGGRVVVWVILGVVLTIKGGVHRGEIDFCLLDSAVRGCNLSGLRALRSKGEPGSALLGRLNDFLAELGVSEEPKGE